MSTRNTLQDAITNGTLNQVEATQERAFAKADLKFKVVWSPRVEKLVDSMPHEAFVLQGEAYIIDMEWLLEAAQASNTRYDTSKQLSNPVIPSKPVAPATSRLTTDRADPRLTRGVDDKPVPQADAYLVLSEDEIAKGYIRPVRTKYTHKGRKPMHPLVDLTEAEKELIGHRHVKFEQFPDESTNGDGPLRMNGRYWSQAELDSGCGTVTSMGLLIAQTYARDPKFYGSTYCVNCSKHLPVHEFVWDDGTVVGS